MQAADPDQDATAILAALCATFTLNPREARLLLELMLSDGRTMEELRIAAAPTGKHNSMIVYMSRLRKKLRVFDVWINHAQGIGYILRKDARRTIQKHLDKHNAAVRSVRNLKAEVARTPP